jgi:tetratricopeptide (TPR) repeat protein
MGLFSKLSNRAKEEKDRMRDSDTGNSIDGWWSEPELRAAILKALDAAGYQGLTVWPGGVRPANSYDDMIKTADMCRLTISRVRRHDKGMDIVMCSPAGAYELFIREGKPLGFLPIGERGSTEDIKKAVEELGAQLRKGLLEQNLDEKLQEAFACGESPIKEKRLSAVRLYLDILKTYPDMKPVWFNLGVIQNRAGDKQEAIRAFRKAKEDPLLELAASYAILLLMVELKQSPSEDDMPRGFEGGWGALGVQGPCHNAANWLRARGYTCTVESKGESSSIYCHNKDGDYIIKLNDVMGSLIRNVFKKGNGESVSLADMSVLNDTERELMLLNVGRLSLMQVPVSEAVEAGDYRVWDRVAEEENGCNTKASRWVRAGRTFDEEMAYKKAEAKQSGVELVQIVTIEDIAKWNRVPGTFLACCLNGEPHALAMPHELDEALIPDLKRSVEEGFCFFRAGFYEQPEFPLVHIGLVLPAKPRDGTGTANYLIVENVANYVEANFQEWVEAIEARQYTWLDAFAPDGRLLASGRTYIDPQIISDIVKSVDKADAFLKTIPEDRKSYKTALDRFYKEHPDPFV